jgi:hypothetical protein
VIMATGTSAATSVSTMAAASVRVGLARAAIIALALSIGVVAVAVLWQPWGERNQIGYADIAPHRDAAWLGAVVNGFGFATIGVTLGLAVCMLAPRRGSTWANVGAVLTGIGGVTLRRPGGLRLVRLVRDQRRGDPRPTQDLP